MKAYSPSSGIGYSSYAELVAAEANGYVVVFTSERPNTGALVLGPFDTKADANRLRNRQRPHLVRDEHPHKVHSSVRVLWKGV